MKDKRIRVLITGGTFDKEYDMINGKLYFDESHLPKLLELGRCTLNIKYRTLMMIDSLDMTMQDRQIILNNCQRVEEERIVITHGTDTMVETAQILAEAQLNKTIVLTGALIPFKFGSSDGLFNMGTALAFVQSLPPDVYIAMNGQFFPWNKVRKNKSTGFFESL